MTNVYGLILSYVFVFLIIGLSTVLQKKNIVGEEGARKFIHIGVSNWYLIAWYFFDNVWLAIIAPITFIILNYVSYKQNIFKAMERGGEGNLGTVYFPISLLILVYITFGPLNSPYIGALGILVLGYGDGLAAVIGSKYGKHQLKHGKSLEGSITMFLASFIVSAFILAFSISTPWFLIAIFIALIATIIELYTPRGLDNLSVPLMVSLLYYVLFILI
jgi:phytol kinase